MSLAKESWWQTLPGIVTAIAGAITAVGGLLLTLNQIGWIGGGSASASRPAEPSAAITASAEGSAASLPSRYTVEFTGSTEATVRSNRASGVYKILGAQVEDRNTGTLVLKINVRLTNIGQLDIAFSTDYFRLLVDDVPRPPTSYLNGSVDRQSAKEAVIEFDLPATATGVVLLIDNGDDRARLPLTLKRAE
jgi:hypothetical protein